MEDKKTDKRKVQGAETKRKLVEIADRLFRERSYSDVSVEDITHEAGITKGAFYVHFASKDALIALLIADYTARTDADYKAVFDTFPPNMPASGVLLALTEKIADVLTGDIGYDNIKKIYQILLTGAVDAKAVKSYDRELYTLFYGILEQGIRKGEFQSDLPVEVLSRHFVMAIRGICIDWCIQYPNVDLKAQSLEHCQMLMQGLQNE